MKLRGAAHRDEAVLIPICTGIADGFGVINVRLSQRLPFLGKSGETNRLPFRFGRAGLTYYT
jgi:hypothetical protein